MQITICKSKIHRATITETDLNYVGSITIDEELMRLADLVEYEQVQIANINNGERFETYVITGPACSGTIALNGAAARRGEPGDLIIIIAYGLIDRTEADTFSPRVVHVDSRNKPTEVPGENQ
jgi:aspartate 1-decarboxylase